MHQSAMRVAARHLDRSRTLAAIAILGATAGMLGVALHSAVAVVAGLASVLLTIVYLLLRTRAALNRVAKVNLSKDLERHRKELKRLLSSHNKALVDVGAQQAQLLGADLRTLIEGVDSRVRQLPSSLERANNHQTAEVGALIELSHRVPPDIDGPLRPALGGWAVNPTTMLELLYLVRKRQPQLLLELGSGASTVWLAQELAAYGGSIISLDHEEQFAGKTREWLDLHGLSDRVDVRHAPLEPVEPDGSPWYSLSALEGLSDIDFLIVDGPPAKMAKRMRYPALGATKGLLREGATIVLDDFRRKEEQEVLEIWLEENHDITLDPSTFGTHAVLRYAAK